MENAMLTFDNVSAHYGKIQALHNVSLHIKQGEIVTLIGANGAGKTTTFRMLCGLLVPSKGQIEVAGYDLRTAKAGARARIGYVAQKFSLYGKLSVEQNLRYFGRSYGFFGQALQDRIDASLEDFGLTYRRQTTSFHGLRTDPFPRNPLFGRSHIRGRPCKPPHLLAPHQCAGGCGHLSRGDDALSRRSGILRPLPHSGCGEGAGAGNAARSEAARSRSLRRQRTKSCR